MTPAEEIANYLAEQGVGTLGGDAEWALFFQRMPDQPDSAICLYDGGGPEPIVYDEEIRVPFVEVRVRGADYTVVADKAQEIFEKLCEPGGLPADARQMGGGSYIGIWLDSDFIDIGRDENDRFRISSNYRCNRQPMEALS